MDYDKLIERLRNAAGGPEGIRMCQDAATAIETLRIKRGDKISQLVILPVLYLTPVQVDKIEGGERGDNGFGSTGR